MAGKKYKFRVVAGHHAVDLFNEEGVQIGTEVYGPGARKMPNYKGDVIETDTDLAGRFNRIGSIKFEPVEPELDTPEAVQQKIDELRKRKAELEEKQLEKANA